MRRSSAAAALLALLPAACAGPRANRSDSSLGWQCSATTTSADVSASSTRLLDPDGSPRSDIDEWEWRLRQGDVEVSMQQWHRFAGPDSRVLIFVNLPRPLVGRIVTVELSIGDGVRRETDPDFVNRGRRQSQVALRPRLEALLALSASGRRVYVAGFDRRGAVAFRVPLDLGAISRGREAMRASIERSTEMMRNFRSLCERETPLSTTIIT